jgi:hypothetical protein
MRYFEWDFEALVVTEYARSGECNNCGDCCGGEVHYAFQRRDINEQIDMRATGGGYVMDGTGIWQEIQDGDVRLFRKFQRYESTGTVCGNLVDNKCALQSIGKPLLCQLWPVAPREIEVFLRCSYAFAKLAEWPIETLAP